MCGGSGGSGKGKGSGVGGVSIDMNTPASELSLQKRIDTMQQLKNAQAKIDMQRQDLANKHVEQNLDTKTVSAQDRELRNQREQYERRWSSLRNSYDVGIVNGRRVARSKKERVDLGPS